VACRAIRDEHGTTYIVPCAKVLKTPGGQVLPGIPEAQVWWARRFKDRADETLLIRQENNPQGADVIELTLGQVYDLIHALGHAVMRP
jgi:hypothetical protein